MENAAQISLETEKGGPVQAVAKGTTCVMQYVSDTRCGVYNYFSCSIMGPHS